MSFVEFDTARKRYKDLKRELQRVEGLLRECESECLGLGGILFDGDFILYNSEAKLIPITVSSGGFVTK